MKTKIARSAIYAMYFLSSLASAASFTCTDSMSGKNVAITVSQAAIHVLKQVNDSDFGTQALAFDPTYKPRADHAGALRYRGQNDCGDYQFIIDAQMAHGQSGHATFAQDCDSDGTGPGFENYRCSVN